MFYFFLNWGWIILISAVPGKPGSANVSASEATSGADWTVVDSTATGAGICTAGTIVIGFTDVLDVALLSARADVKSGSLGIEFARFGAGSGFGLGGTCGDLGLLSEPVMDLNDGQYDLTLSLMEGCRPLSSGEDFGTSCPSVTCGELDSLDAAVASCVGAGEDGIRPAHDTS